MRSPSPLPPAGSGGVFLTEGGTETEIMCRHGFDLPEFAMFPLLDDPKAVMALRAMFRAQLDVAAEFGLSFLLSGLDYRASPDWGEKLGYSSGSLADGITEIDTRTGEGAPGFYLLNCSHPIEYEPVVDGGGWMEHLRGVRPNASKMDERVACAHMDGR